MACDLASGKVQVCADVLGGLKEVLVVNFDDLDGTLTVASNAISDSSATFTAYRFKVRNSSSEKQGAMSTVEIGASGNYHKHSLELVTHGWTTQEHVAFDALAKGRFMAFAHDNNGDVWCLGRVRGLEAESGEANLGKETGDFSGYKVTLSGEEDFPPMYCGAQTTNPLDNWSSATITYSPTY